MRHPHKHVTKFLLKNMKEMKGSTIKPKGEKSMQKDKISNYIVRADFYPNGDILPLGITDCSGDSMMIQSAKPIFGDKKRFNCTTCDGKQVLIAFENGRWFVEDN